MHVRSSSGYNGSPNGGYSGGIHNHGYNGATNVGGYRGTLTSAGSSQESPESNVDGRELTEFERENLLFLKDLDNR